MAYNIVVVPSTETWQLPGSIVPLAEPYAGGSFTLATGQAAIFLSHLELTGTQRATLQGTARVGVL